jgi:hypothetical protein
MEQLFFKSGQVDKGIPWNKNRKGKYPVACTLTNTVVRLDLISMRFLLRRADCGFFCHMLALFSFLQIRTDHCCR